MHGRGRKLNQTKNYVAAADFAAGKKVGRPKQKFVWDVTEIKPLPHTPLAVGDKLIHGTVIAVDMLEYTLGISGHWERANVSK